MIEARELFKRLLQFDTTNGHRNEIDCIKYIQSVLADAGIESQLYEKVSGRPNLIARLKGSGDAPPFLMQGHVDVVTTANQKWTHPPFDAVESDGYIWGRGAIDMKGGVAMMIAAMLRAKSEKIELAGDVILCILSDEEAGGTYGAKFMVEEHSALFEGVKYAIGEFGGFTNYIAGKPFYPIMIAEKQKTIVRATFIGDAGHGSMPIKGGAMSHLGKALTRLDNHRLPVHVTPSVKLMIEGISNALSGVPAILLKQLLNPMLTDNILKLMGQQGRIFDPLLHNTVSPTILEGSDKINVIPAQVTLKMDGRILPGLTDHILKHEVQSLLGNNAMIDVENFQPYPADPDMSMYELLAEVLQEANPNGIPVPFVLPAVTDGRHFAKIGIQTYGFTPMKLPKDFNFSATVHAADERIPIGAIDFGTSAIFEVLKRL